VDNGGMITIDDILNNDELSMYLDQLKELEEVIRDLQDVQFRDTFGFGFSDLMNDFIGTLDNAKDDVDAFGKSFEDVWQKNIINTIKRTIAEGSIKELMDMFNLAFDDGTIDEAEYQAMRNFWIQQGEAAKKKSEELSKIMGESFSSLSDPDKSLTGAVKGVTEETASMVGGQMNAIRINQMEATEILRQQLMQLATIAQNTSYNFHLAKLDRIVTLLENGQAGDTLRAHGLG
jgi:exonuclease VII small subunit